MVKTKTRLEEDLFDLDKFFDTHGWVQGFFNRTFFDSSKHCDLAGATWAVIRDRPPPRSPGAYERVYTLKSDWNRVIGALLARTIIDLGYVEEKPGVDPIEILLKFNDHPARTFREIRCIIRFTLWRIQA